MEVYKCEYDIDEGTINVLYTNGTKLIIHCQEIEDKLETTVHSRSKLEWLLDNDPMGYVMMVLDNELQDYCDIIDRRIVEQSRTISKQLLENGCSKIDTENIVREFYMYDR